MLIKEIKAEDTWELRRSVMWPTKSLEYVKLDDDSIGQHFGLFSHTKLVSVVSLFIEDNKAQFRKFATDTNEQGKGYGTALLTFVFNKLVQEGVTLIWCNARTDKVAFYKRFGMQETNQRFDKGGISYTIMERGEVFSN